MRTAEHNCEGRFAKNVATALKRDSRLCKKRSLKLLRSWIWAFIPNRSWVQTTPIIESLIRPTVSADVCLLRQIGRLAAVIALDDELLFLIRYFVDYSPV